MGDSICQAGSEGETTTALKGVGGQLSAPAPSPRERYKVHTVQEVGRAAGPIWTGPQISSPKGTLTPDRPDNVTVRGVILLVCSQAVSPFRQQLQHTTWKYNKCFFMNL